MKLSKGFTLIEVIVTMIIMAIAAALFVSYMGGTSFKQSPASAGLVNKQYRLIQQMEIITSKYRQALPIADICAFKGTYVDGKEFVDPANTWCNQGLTSGTYTTQNVLLVTLTDGQQTLQSIFTQ